MGTDAARLAGREEEKKVQREAEKMNSCASRAHTSNFHFARGSGSGGSRRAVQSPGLARFREIRPRRGAQSRASAPRAASSKSRSSRARGAEADGKGKRKTRARSRDPRPAESSSRGVAWTREEGKHGRSTTIDLI